MGWYLAMVFYLFPLASYPLMPRQVRILEPTILTHLTKYNIPKNRVTARTTPVISLCFFVTPVKNSNFVRPSYLIRIPSNTEYRQGEKIATNP